MKLYHHPLSSNARKAVMTATLSAVPARLFDGAWTRERRAQLVQLALAAAERIAPGISRTVMGGDGPPDSRGLGLTLAGL